jgi:hexosaminidase
MALASGTMNAIFPLPRLISTTARTCDTRVGVRILCADLPDAEDIIRRRLGEQGNGLAIEASVTPDSSLSAQAYRLTINPGEIALQAATPAGLYYAAASLAFLLREGKPLDCGEIEDEPAQQFRGIHLDLKRLGWNQDYLKQLLPRLGAIKINAVLLEYEDKFPYQKHPDIAVSSALTPEDIVDLRRLAREHFIEIVPLVQSLGHLEYLLTLPRYSHLSEDTQVKSDICPQNPEAVALVREMMEEVLAAHPESRYFHIGADEPFRLGSCPRCRQAGSEGKGEIYFEHVNLLCELVCARGKTPILWSDVLEGHPEMLSQLHPAAIVMYWDYRSEGEEVNFFINRSQEGGVLYEDAVLSRLPESFLDIYRPYIDTGKMPKLYKSLPYMQFFKDRGREVIGATHVKQIDNCLAHAKRCRESGALGTVATAWAAHNSLADPIGYLELRMKGVYAEAAFSWEQHTSRESFEKRFIPALYGSQLEPLRRACEIVAERRDILHPNSASELSGQREELASLREALETLQNTFTGALTDNLAYLRLVLAKFVWESDLATARESLVLVPPEAAAFIDLSGHANRAFKDTPEVRGWSEQGKDENDLRPLPVGVQTFRGVTYRIIDPDANGGRACLMGSGDPARGFPRETRGIPVNAKMRHLFFLHALVWENLTDGKCGRYVIHYADGTETAAPIIKKDNINGWWKPRDLPEADVAWAGNNLHSEVGLYSFRWDNSRPDSIIASLDVIVDDPVVLGLVAITGSGAVTRKDSRTGEAVASLRRLRLELDELTAGAAQLLPRFHTPDAAEELREFMFSAHDRKLSFLLNYFA